MIPYNLPRGTPLVCIDDEGSSRPLCNGRVYRLVRYQGDDFVVLLHPDGADYQAADDVDLVNH
jgi:hypothetical protein